MANKTTTIQVHLTTWKRLRNAEAYPKEPFNNIINRKMDEAENKEAS